MDQQEFEKWAGIILSSKRYSDDVDRFLEAVENVEGHLDERCIETLLKTFTDDDSYGIQETVLEVLNSGGRPLYYGCLLKELPSLIARTQQKKWFRTLISSIFNYGDSDLLAYLAKHESKNIKDALLSVISASDFIEDHPKSKKIIRDLNA